MGGVFNHIERTLLLEDIVEKYSLLQVWTQRRLNQLPRTLRCHEVLI